MLLMLKNDIHVHSIAHDNEIYILVIQKKKKKHPSDPKTTFNNIQHKCLLEWLEEKEN